MIRYKVFQLTKLLYVVCRRYHKGLGLILATQYHRLLASSCRPSVCNAVHYDFYAGSELVYRTKSYMTACITANFLFVRSDAFAVGSFSHKMHGKKRVQENANVSSFDFWDTENHAWIGLACCVHCWELEKWEDRHRELWASPFGGLSLVAFIKSNRLNQLAWRLGLFEK